MTGVDAVSVLRRLVEIESPTYSPGVERVADVMAEELGRLGGESVVLEGGHLRAEFAGEGSPVLVVGHTDTVWPEGTLDRMPFRIEGDSAYGPGAYDMKGCLVVLLAALASGGGRRRPVRVFLTADEEQGSRTARDPLKDAALGVCGAFVVEPPTAKGHLKTARKGLGRFRVVITGRPAHAGTNLVDGASAVEELAHQVIRLHALTDHERGISVNVGVVSGGTRENVVAASAEAGLDVRVVHEADREHVERALGSLRPTLEGTTIEVTGDWTRPPLEPTAASRRLFAKAREHGRALGLELEEASSGGGSDANLVGALGVPVLDGLGADGGGAHAHDEHVRLDSIPVRAALLGRLLEDPGL
jgi:glutamate carboxypeptidase